MAYRKGMGHNNGSTRVVQTITIVLLAFWSCLTLAAQINNEVFIQCKMNDCIMCIKHCMVLLVGYAVCFAPITIYWITSGFEQDKYL